MGWMGCASSLGQCFDRYQQRKRAAGLSSCCPFWSVPQLRAENSLFSSITAFADNCRACGLDYDKYNVGDGPAAFLTLIVGGIILALALVVELNYYPPIWVHAVLWFPLDHCSRRGSLRVSKALLLILEHRNQAREGSLDHGDEK